MKRILKIYLILVSICITLLYISAWFITLEPVPTSWSLDVRVLFSYLVLCMLALGVPLAALIDLESEQ